MCSNHSDCSPLSSLTCSRYFPSGDIAASVTWPLFVRFSIENFSNGTCRVFRTRVYTPKIAAASRTAITPRVTPVPNLCLLAVAIRTEPLEGAGAGVALVPAGVGVDVGPADADDADEAAATW